MKAEEQLAELQASLAEVQEAFEVERQARQDVEKALVQAEGSLASARRVSGQEDPEQDEAKNARSKVEQDEEIDRIRAEEVEEGEAYFSADILGGAAQRLTFVIRLAIDEHKKPLRTEIVHVQSGKKGSFPKLDIQLLAAFMESCFLPSDPPAVVEEKIPDPLPLRDKLAANLSVSTVRTKREGSTDECDLIFYTGEDLSLWIDFQLQGPDALRLAEKQTRYTVQVFAQDTIQTRTFQLGLFQSHLEKNALEYTPTMKALILTPGIYRLVSLVSILEPVRLGSYYEGPLIQVKEAVITTPKQIEPAGI